MRRAFAAVGRRLHRRPAVAAGLIYAAIIVVFLGPGLLPGRALSSSDWLWHEPPWVSAKPEALGSPSNPDLGDWSEYLHPFAEYSAAATPRVPLWNPHLQSGRPYEANAQSALFGPFTWPLYVLPFWTAVGWIAVLKLWVAALGTYLLGRALGMRFGGALVAGIAFALSLKMVTWLIYPTAAVWSLYPWVLLAVERLVRRPSLLSGAGLAVVVALQLLCGHPESSFHALLLAASFFVLRTWQAHRHGAPDRGRLGPRLLAFGAAVAGGAALAAIAVVPFVELVLRSADFVDRRGVSVDAHLPLRHAIGFLLPDFWGRPTQTPIEPIMLERALYVGALPLMLASAALMLRPRGLRAWVAAFGAFWAAVVLGIPPFVQIVTRLPIFSSGHNTRLIVFSVLALALLAGWGLDDLAQRRAGRDRAVAGTVLALLALPIAIVAVASPSAFGVLPQGFEIAWLFADPPGSFRDPQGVDVIRASALMIWLAVAGAAALLVLRGRARLAPAAFVALAAVLLCIDLFRAGMGQNPAIDQSYAAPPKTDAIGFLQRQRPARFVSTQEFPHNVIALRFGLYEARGYDLPIIRRYDRLWRQELQPGTSVSDAFLSIPLELREITPRALRTLRLLGVAHVLGPKSLEPAAPPFDRLVPVPPLRVPGLILVYDGPDARVYSVDGALPRAWVVGAQTTVPDDDAALAAITRPGFDARRVAVTERPVAGVPLAGEQPSANAGRARILRYDDDRVDVRARLSRPGMVILSDTHYPGWKATVDGRAAPIERVDYVLRGVRVGAGEHEVTFRYEPASWRIGWIVSLLALLGLAVVVAVAVRRERRRGDRPPLGRQIEEPAEPEPARA